MLFRGREKITLYPTGLTVLQWEHRELWESPENTGFERSHIRWEQVGTLFKLGKNRRKICLFLVWLFDLRVFTSSYVLNWNFSKIVIIERIRQ